MRFFSVNQTVIKDIYLNYSLICIRKKNLKGISIYLLSIWLHHVHVITGGTSRWLPAISWWHVIHISRDAPRNVYITLFILEFLKIEHDSCYAVLYFRIIFFVNVCSRIIFLYVLELHIFSVCVLCVVL